MEKAERETVINWNDADNYISIYTCHRGVMNCLDKMGLVPERRSRDGREYFVPRKFLAYSGKSIRIRNVGLSKRKGNNNFNKAKSVLKTPSIKGFRDKLSKDEGLSVSSRKKEG